MRCSINRVILFALLCGLLVGCRRNDALVIVPTLSPTPRSTPLPPIPTRAAAGSRANPIQLAVVSSDEDSAEALATALSEATELTIQVLRVEQPSQSLAALCASPSDTATAAWLDGLTALAAQAQGCGDFTLALEQSGSTTKTYQLIATSDIETAAALAEQTFCRISVTDRDTWLYPSLLLQAEGVDLVSFEEIVDYDDMDALLAAVIDGDCDGAGVPTESLETLSSADHRNLTLLNAQVNIPYGVLVYPQVIPLSAREAIDSAFLSLTNDDEQGELLQTLLGADALRPSDALDFESLREVIDTAGLNLAQMGS